MENKMFGNVNQRAFYTLYAINGLFENEMMSEIYNKFTEDIVFSKVESIIVKDYFLKAVFESDLGVKEGIINEFMNIIVPKLDASTQVKYPKLLSMLYKAYTNSRNESYSEFFCEMYKKLFWGRELSQQEMHWIKMLLECAINSAENEVKDELITEYSYFKEI